MPTSSELYPICILLITFLTVGWLVSRRYPLTDIVDDRAIQIDGLRALLAFGVMTFHFFGIRNLLIDGTWHVGNLSKITSLFGTWTVSIFFAITSYLFIQRVVGSEDQRGRSVVRFLFGRCFRLIPTSLLSALIFLLANTKVYTDFGNTHLLIHNCKGLLNVAVSSLIHPASGPNSALIESWAWGIALGSSWTLHFEWIFYISLASISLVSFKKHAVLVQLILIFVLVFVIRGTKEFYVNWDHMTWAFIPGMILGLTNKYWKNNKYLSHPVAAVIALMAVLGSGFYSVPMFKISANTLFLATILCKNRFTSCLESKRLRSLGETTYSLYLLHGFVQYATLKWVVTIPIGRYMPGWTWWLICGIQVVIIVIVSRISFEFVEKPGIQLGKRFYVCFMNLISRQASWLLTWI